MIERRKSKIHGWGVYTTQVIPKNTRIIHYGGEKISNQVSLKRELRYLKTGHIWCFKLTNRTVIDAGVGGNVARFINHGCRPNCYVQIRDGVIWIRAAITIKRGEELTYHYNTDGEALFLPFGRRRSRQTPAKARTGFTLKCVVFQAEEGRSGNWAQRAAKTG